MPNSKFHCHWETKWTRGGGTRAGRTYSWARDGWCCNSTKICLLVRVRGGWEFKGPKQDPKILDQPKRTFGCFVVCSYFLVRRLHCNGIHRNSCWASLWFTSGRAQKSKSITENLQDNSAQIFHFKAEMQSKLRCSPSFSPSEVAEKYGEVMFPPATCQPTVSQAESKTPNSGNGFGNATGRFGLMQTMGKGCWQNWTCAVKQAGDIALQIRRRWVRASLLGWMVLMVLGCVGDVLMLSYFFDCAIDFKMLGSPKVIPPRAQVQRKLENLIWKLTQMIGQPYRFSAQVSLQSCKRHP